jgi:hypothetical protein
MKHLYQKGHKYHPPYSKHPGGPSTKRPSIRQQRKAQVETVSSMLDEMAEQHRAGKPVDPQAYATLLHAQRRLLQEL